MWTSPDAARVDRGRYGLDKMDSPEPAGCWEVAAQREEIIAPSTGWLQAPGSAWRKIVTVKSRGRADKSTYIVGGFEKKTVLQGRSGIRRVSEGLTARSRLVAGEIFRAIVDGTGLIIFAGQLVVRDVRRTRGRGVDGGAQVFRVRLEVRRGLGERRERMGRHGRERIRQVSKNARNAAIWRGRVGHGRQRQASGGGGEDELGGRRGEETAAGESL